MQMNDLKARIKTIRVYFYQNLMHIYTIAIKWYKKLVIRIQNFSTFMSKCTIYRCFLTFYIVYKTEINYKQLTKVKIVL